MFNLYDVAVIDSDCNFKIIQVLALSEIDAMHIVEIKHTDCVVKDAVISL